MAITCMNCHRELTPQQAGEPCPTCGSMDRNLAVADQAVAREKATVARELAKLLKIDLQALRSPDRGWAISKARTIAAYVLVRRLGYRLSDVAAYFGRDIATLATLLARLSDRVQANDTARREIERLNEIVES